MMLGNDGGMDEISVLLDSKDRIMPESTVQITRDKDRRVNASQNSSLLAESALFTSNTAGRSTRGKKSSKPTSASKGKKL